MIVITSNANRGVSKLFRAYGLYNDKLNEIKDDVIKEVSKLFRAYGLYNVYVPSDDGYVVCKFQSSFELTGYITYALWKVHEY